MFHPLSHIYAKTPFGCVEIVANNTLNHQCVVVFDQLCTNTELTAFWYLLLPSYLTQFQFTISQNEFVECFGVFQDNCQICVS